MPIKIANNLPAAKILDAENILVIPEERAVHQDIRPLRIAIVNLMPTKIETETQLLRLLGNSPLQVDIDLIQMASHVSKTIAPEHLLQFYKTHEQLRDNRYDGLIITGAPVEKLEFDDVDYWEELQGIMDWSRGAVWSTLHICWGAQAGLYHHYGIQKRLLSGGKLSGIYPHHPSDVHHPLLHGFDDVFFIPHSRYTEICGDQLAAEPRLYTLVRSPQAGEVVMATADSRQVFITGHCEYDLLTLDGEYRRDLAKGISPEIPANYYPGNDPARQPDMLWRSHANLFFANWLHVVYQQTPYDLKEL
ncbi:MAG: homoserine O-succinyltransferase [Oscillospiraceae bacterium]|nr:homoserine O-succinyltransferase [Oscillospiraceae bacterium]